MLVIGSLNFVESKSVPLVSGLFLDRYSIRTHFDQDTLKIPPAVAGPVSSNPDPLPPVCLKILEPREWTVYAWRRDFQRISAIHWVVNVQQIT